MFKALAVIVLLLASAIPVPAHNDAIAHAHKTTHVIHLATILEETQCSATAIGPHALLTASHCELPTEDLDVDDQPAHILALTRDKMDHTIFLVDIAFSDWASFSSDKLEIGDRVFIFGNPGELNDVYREGYLAGQQAADPVAEFFGVGAPCGSLYDLNSWHGDSGAAIFNSRGEIVDVVTALTGNSDKDKPAVSIKFTVGMGLAFTPKQLQGAATF